ncbi:MAG TPA: T9SS type A sorting domain-containing protein, partial [Bacteroidales bacterium]|nr:T9SS type A sorting domain-containing protein [Bacteroidales bacterium]
LYGSKTINKIFILNSYAYLATGFGIVKINLERKEIDDTYYIGTNASYINVHDITFDGSYFYAATENGIYKTNGSSNLADFNNWIKITYIPSYNEDYTHVIFYNNAIYSVLTEGSNGYNFLIKFQNNTYSLIDTANFKTIRNLNTANNKLIVSHDTTVSIFTSDITTPVEEYSRLTLYWDALLVPFNAIEDKNGVLWIADKYNGLIKLTSNTTGISSFPNGPQSNSVYDISSAGNEVWVAYGGLNISGANLWLPATVFAYYNYSWHTINGNKQPLMANQHDIVTVCINPYDPTIVYAGSWNDGIFEFDNHQCIAHYEAGNSSLEEFSPGDEKIADMAFDSNQNLWILNPGTNNPVSVKKNDGSWKNFNYSYISNDLRKILVTSSDKKWVILGNGQGLLIFDNGSDIDNESDDRIKHLNVVDEGGTIITNDLYSIAEDLDGIIWIGTGEGVVTYYNPDNVFDDPNFNASRILLDLGDGTAQYLLKYETITTIAIDGANRKWFGTANSGAFLLSEDCSEQILHFTESNSPLFSDKILNISINNTTGEVFFATDKGLVSYRNDATEGLTTFNQPYAFPNPVSNGYEGVISLIGLVRNAHVKITDISGNLVYETIANGGMATWNGKDFQGNKVHTGIYLAFCSNDDGSETKVIKILIIK